MPNVGPLELLVVIAIAAFWLAIIGLLAYGAVTLGRRRRAPAAPDVEDPALADLRTRFARGEIDEAEYQRRRSILQGP
jgi:uncharacterized membrane protein